MSIRPLPPDVIAQIKSSISITSLNGVICDLVKNSLDASATKIDVSIDYSRGGCCVEDDGLGILPSEFGTDGLLGKLHREFSRTSESLNIDARQIHRKSMLKAPSMAAEEPF